MLSFREQKWLKTLQAFDRCVLHPQRLGPAERILPGSLLEADFYRFAVNIGLFL